VDFLDQLTNVFSLTGAIHNDLHISFIQLVSCFNSHSPLCASWSQIQRMRQVRLYGFVPHSLGAPHHVLHGSNDMQAPINSTTHG
jgi:hypothetical protein